jgi:hypothetical protein
MEWVEMEWVERNETLLLYVNFLKNIYSFAKWTPHSICTHSASQVGIYLPFTS